MIPGFTSDGLLPPGEYLATWGEFSAHFGWNQHRKSLLGGLAAALVPLRTAGCSRVFVDGSFVTTKDFPGDFDAAWDPQGVDFNLLFLLEPLFWEFQNQRAAQKAKYLGEFFPASSPADSVGTTFLDFFQNDKQTGNKKGIIVLNP